MVLTEKRSPIPILQEIGSHVEIFPNPTGKVHKVFSNPLTVQLSFMSRDKKASSKTQGSNETWALSLCAFAMALETADCLLKLLNLLWR